ncbi:DUF333 domain-containing protein [Pantoea sp. 1.19]|uniref:putative hemolysin n=1 Tax=Pantoea sp. 1.19 TaxID=1925589 RepID=UPI0009490AB4|nr:DUF333 domain-containing protein [Pantoea sp. 1.19]
MRVATIFLFAALLSACSSSNEPPQQATAAHVPMHVSMSAFATEACSGAGGTLALSRQLDGSAAGMCQLANGRRCSESALMSGGCAR